MEEEEEEERAEEHQLEVAPPLDAPEFREYPSDVLHEDMCLQEAMQVTGRDRATETEATEEQHRHLPPLEDIRPQGANLATHGTTAADRVEYLVTEDFHGAQSILLPGRRTYDEGNDPEEGDHHDPALPREEPPEREPALGENPPDPAAALRDASHAVDTRDDMPYREPRGYRPEDVPGDGNCLFHALTTAAGWGETAAQMRQRVVHYAVAHNNDVWSGLPIGQHMQDVLMEERRRYNLRDDAEVNATRFPLLQDVHENGQSARHHP